MADQKNAAEGWGTTTQLTFGPPPPYRLRITGAEFNTDMRRKGSEDILHLCLTGEALNIDTLAPIPEWETHTVELKCGPGWVTPDNGRTAQHKSRELFDGRSRAGIFIDRIVSDSALKGLFKELIKRGKSTEADVYIGLDITIGEEKRKGSGEIPDYGVVVPLEYHGVFDVQEAGERAKQANDELVERLTKIAKEADDHDAFQNEAMALGVSDSKLLEQIMDDSKEGFYAKANK